MCFYELIWEQCTSVRLELGLVSFRKVLCILNTTETPPPFHNFVLLRNQWVTISVAEPQWDREHKIVPSVSQKVRSETEQSSTAAFPLFVSFLLTDWMAATGDGEIDRQPLLNQQTIAVMCLWILLDCCEAQGYTCTDSGGKLQYVRCFLFSVFFGLSEFTLQHTEASVT